MRWSRKNTNKNILDAVKRGRTITNTHEKEIGQLEARQKDLAEENAEIQGAIINSMEKIDYKQRADRADIDRILDYIGLEKNTDSCKKVSYTANSEAEITAVMDDTLNRYNTLSNVSQIVIDENLKYAIADLLAVTTERAMNAKFHNSLSELEKCGILSEDKYKLHIRSVERAKGLVNIGASIVFDVAPLIYDYCSTRIQQRKLREFIIGSVAYVNREMNPLIFKHIWETLMQAGILKANMQMDENLLVAEFNKFSDSNGIYILPMLENKVRMNMQQEEIMAKKIVSICDIENNAVRERALEFLEGFMRLNRQESEALLADAKCSQQFLSEVILYSSINFQTLFSDFAKDMSHACKFARYDLSNDVQKKVRDERKDTMEQIINETLNKKGILFTAGRRADLIQANARVMSASLNYGFEIETALKLTKRNRKVGE